MTHILANIAWSSNDWTEPTLEAMNFEYVKNGNYPHEGYNFKFDHLRNRERREGVAVIYGYVETHGRLLAEYAELNNGRGICFFSSENPSDGQHYVIGIYGHCTAIRRITQQTPYDIPFLEGQEFINLYAPKTYVVCFDPQAQVPLDRERHLAPRHEHLPREFCYLDDREAVNMLEDGIAAHKALLTIEPVPIVQEKIAVLQSLLIEMGRTPTGVQEMGASVPKEEAETYLENQRHIVELQVHTRNSRLVRDAKERDNYTCQICGFRYEDVYGERGRRFAECHHLVPLCEMTGEQQIELDSVITVCANCHRMLHHGGLLAPSELTEIMSQHGWRPNERGE